MRIKPVDTGKARFQRTTVIKSFFLNTEIEDLGEKGMPDNTAN